MNSSNRVPVIYQDLLRGNSWAKAFRFRTKHGVPAPIDPATLAIFTVRTHREQDTTIVKTFSSDLGTIQYKPQGVLVIGDWLATETATISQHSLIAELVLGPTPALLQVYLTVIFQVQTAVSYHPTITVS